MKYPQDDQNEINRLHAEFIVLHEPHNEQVMAFQDASYALGLKRGQAREAALQQRLATAEHQREQLAQAIADATHKAGIVADGAALDGPTLLMVLSDLAECQLATQQRLNEAEQLLTDARTMLAEHQWHYRPYDRGYYCPECGGDRDHGQHNERCAIGAFLSQVTKDSPEVGS
ncbi:hypothetical protein [Pseudomonas sp. RIT-To-2]|uniref:hypothetical protein n=1 Tax=Pseudomonas sp. RIT-To-2 TaxID=3462541 RepID=UPI0024133BCD